MEAWGQVCSWASRAAWASPAELGTLVSGDGELQHWQLAQAFIIIFKEKLQSMGTAGRIAGISVRKQRRLGSSPVPWGLSHQGKNGVVWPGDVLTAGTGALDAAQMSRAVRPSWLAPFTSTKSHFREDSCGQA